MDQTDIEDLDAVAVACRDAAAVILESLEAILAASEALDDIAPDAAAAISTAALQAMEACAFQDLVGQRLGRVRNGRSDDILLAGPQDAGVALSQDSVDALFA